MKHAVLVLGAVLVSQVLTAADWPQFRGPGGQGIDTGNNRVPATWSDSENLRWKTPLPGAGASSPIVVGDRVYVTCYSGYGLDREAPGDIRDLRLHVVCAGLREGDVKWDRAITPKQPEKENIRDHGYAAGTPACDGQALYVFFGRTGVFKLDLEGNVLWQADVGSGTHGWGSGTSPVLSGDVVIVNASVESGSLVALDRKNGKEVWRQGGMKMSWNTPHIAALPDGSKELVVSVKDQILAFDPETGKRLWTCEGIHDYVCPSIVSKDGVVYALGGRKSQAVAVRAGGRGDVTGTHRLWVADAGANVASPVIHNGHLYWVSDRNTTAYCLRLEDGSVVYAEKFPAQPYASAVLADGRLHVVARWGGTYVYPAKPEFEAPVHNRFSDRSVFNGSPAVADNGLILRSDRFLYCIGSAGGGHTR